MPQADEALTARLNAAGFGRYQWRMVPCGFLVTLVCNCYPSHDVYFRDDLMSDFKISRDAFPAASSLAFLGWALGAPITIQLSDMYGRKLVLCWCSGLGALVSFLYACAPSFAMYCALKPFAGIASAGLAANTFLLICESAATESRAFLITLIHVYNGLSWIVLASWSYLIRDFNWRTQVMIVQSGTSIFMLIYTKMVAFESPRWLALTHGPESAHIVVDAMVAGKLAWRTPTRTTQSSSSTASLAQEWPWKKLPHLCGHSLRVPFVILIVAWMLSITVYFGLALLTNSVGGNTYLNGVIFGLMEIPPQLILTFLIERPAIGRRFSYVGSLGLQGLAMLFFALLGKGSDASLWFAYLAKASNSMAFTVAYIYAAELFPTEVRGSALGILNIFARTSAGLGTLLTSLPVNVTMLIFGITSVCAAGATLLLRETLGQDLDDLVGGREPLKEPGVELTQAGS